MRTRTTVSTGTTQILPSQILPVRAAVAHDLDQGFHLLGSNHQVQANLGHQIDLVLGSPVDLGVTTLTGVAVSLGHGHPVDSEGAHEPALIGVRAG